MSERVCTTCGEAAPIDANWCEACGSDLDAPVEAPPEPAYVATMPCVSCAADISEITDDGWCQLCGTKQPAPGDHVVDDQGEFAVVSDRGRKHRTNEDAGAVGATDDVLALVVCDGVSSTDDAHHASQAAAKAAVDVLLTSGSPAGARLHEAAQAAQRAVVEATPAAVETPPSCTFVAALVDLTDAAPTTITVGWLGDSRAYWSADSGTRLLTRDHTWASEQRLIATLTDEEIASDKRAHSITRWLGKDALDVAPEVVEITIEEPGLLIVCSDGLWNYAAPPEQLHQVVDDRYEHGIAVVDLAEKLVAFANEAGGHDNITVAVARFPSVLAAPPAERDAASGEAGTASSSEQTTTQPPPTHLPSIEPSES